MATTPPTAKQLHVLRQLAGERGMTFTWPETATQASAEIRRLTSTRRSSPVERRLDRQGLVEARAAVTPASSVQAGETTGYGSSATWACGTDEAGERTDEAPRPSQGQLDLIRTLASERGVTSIQPSTMAAASAEITRLKALPRPRPRRPSGS